MSMQFHFHKTNPVSKSFLLSLKTPEREVGGSILTQVAVLYLVIPRKRWLRLDMTEKLLIGT